MPVLIDDVDTSMQRLLDGRADLTRSAQRLAPAARRRQWLELLSTNRLDAWLIAWGRDSELAAHDHGDSHAAVHVLRGCLVEWYRDHGDRAAWNVREVASGQTITVPTTRIHEVHQCGPDVTVSVHVYSPPLRSMGTHPPVHSLGASRGPAPAAVPIPRIA